MRPAGILLLGILSWAANARADNSYLIELLREAEIADLATRREWRVLLHYRPTADGAGSVSDVDDSRFFLAPAGNTDPGAELAATLRAFFDSEPVGGDPQPAQCAFRARYRWLKAELNFDDHRLSPQECERFQHWFRELDAGSATLVFASAYLNNPASLFGHTLLRLDRRGQTEQTRLLAYAINYAADDSNSSVLMYAVDGIAGGFKGKFDVQPYYKLVRTYNDLESRDLWEYRLNLSSPQMDRLLEHIWELRGIEFDYFFFKENCAWQLLTLLEAADPNMRPSDEFMLWTLPADTIRLLVRQPGLIGEVAARPARGTRIDRRYETLNDGEQRLARRLQDDPSVAVAPELTRLAPERQALLLELALDERQRRRAGKIAEGGEPPPDEVAHRWLIARNRLGVPATSVTVEPYATQPEVGHASARIGTSVGQRDGEPFVELNARAGYHDLLEPDAGYTPDAQIEGVSIAIRHYPDRGGVTLDRLTLLDITSLPSVNRLTPRPAWRIHAGWEPYPRPDCRECTAFNLSGGLGLAVETPWPWRTVWFALPGLEFDHGNQFADDYRAGLGLTVGALLQPMVGWKVLAGATWLDYRSGEAGTALRAVLRQNLALDRDLSLGMDWRYLEGIHEFAIGLRMYF